MRVRLAAVSAPIRHAGIAFATLLLGAITRSAGTQTPADDFFDGIDHPAIAYHSIAPTDRVAQLARRIAAGTETLAYDNETGYLPALLRALDIPVSSQLAVFSRTSLQQAIISVIVHCTLPATRAREQLICPGGRNAFVMMY